MTRHYIIPIFVPHFGCPHDCVFCNQRKITGFDTDINPKDVEKTIQEHLLTFKEDSFIEVAFYGGSFTAIRVDLQEELLSVPKKYKEMGKIDRIRLSTRPDAIDKEILTMLKLNDVDIIELGVQSLDPEVLELSERGHSIEDVHKATELIKSFGFKLGHQIMLGLPGDNAVKSYETARKVLLMKPDMIRIYPTLVIRNTALENMMTNGTYLPMTIQEAVSVSSRILMAFTLAEIPVIRIGLQPTENIQFGKDVVAGPFHPAFRQLVQEHMIRILLLQYISNNSIETENLSLEISCPNWLTSPLAGQHGQNRIALVENLNLSKLVIRGGYFREDSLEIKIGQHLGKLMIADEIRLFLTENPL